MGKKKHVKTQDSASWHRQNLVFYSIVLSLRKAPMDFYKSICLPGEVFGPSPSQSRKIAFSHDNFIYRSMFFEA